MLNTASTPEDKAKIFATIAFIYSETGWRGPAVAAKNAKYCEEALRYPLDPATAAHLYHLWGGDLDSTNRDHHLNAKDFADLRRRIENLYLTGLKLVLANLTAKEREYPGVMKFDCDGGPECVTLRKQNAEQMATREKADFQNKLLDMKRALLRSSSEIYAREPYDAKEFEETLFKYIGDKETRELMLANLQETTNIRNGKYLVKPSSDANRRSGSVRTKKATKVQDRPLPQWQTELQAPANNTFHFADSGEISRGPSPQFV